jgi:hypothetical protein
VTSGGAPPWLFEEALAIPGIERRPFDLARVQLVHGERLRRAQATTESRLPAGTRAAALRRNVTRLVHEDLGVTEEEVLVMVAAIVVILVIIVVLGLTGLGRSLRIVQQYEQGIIFRFGRVLPSWQTCSPRQPRAAPNPACSPSRAASG